MVELEIWRAVSDPGDGHVIAVPPSEEAPPYCGIGVRGRGVLHFVAVYAYFDEELAARVEAISAALADEEGGDG